MPTREHKNRLSLQAMVLPVKALFFRLSLFFAILASLAVILFSHRSGNTATERLRTAVMDVVTPVLGIFARPVDAYHDAREKLHQIVWLYSENERLRQENATLKHAQLRAVELGFENAQLRSLLNVASEGSVSFITARVVGATATPYSHSVLLNAGMSQGIHKGQAVRNANGLVGRVQEVGNHSARVLLLTDVQSRIPVIAENSGERAILAGDNSPYPALKHLPPDTRIKDGDRLVTSGDGGIFPPGIPVGMIRKFGSKEITVKPAADQGRLHYVNVLDYTETESRKPETVQ